ncbi:MAG: RidA family protein [Pseudomonadota bacterium]
MTQRQSHFSASPYEKQFGFCRALRIGQVVHVAGTGPIGVDGKTVGVGDPAAQARRCFDIIQQSLEKLGAGLEDVVRTRMYLTHIDDWKIIGPVHGEYFSGEPPVATLVAVAGLVDPDWRVEIEAEALLPDDHG